MSKGGITVSQDITLVEVALRDGSHVIRHQYTKEKVIEVTKGLNEAKVPYIEVSHGDGIGGSSIQYGFSKDSDIELIRAAKENSPFSKIACLLLPGVGTLDDLKEAREAGADMVRIATHVTEADISAEHIKFAKNELGMEVVGFLMMAHMASPEVLLEQAKLMESYGTDVVYCTDSAGALLPNEVKERIELLVANLNCKVGFHAHNNLGLAIGNTIAAVEAGASFVDGSARSMGAGAGNAQTEVLVAVLDKMNYQTGVDLFKIMDVAQDIIAPLLPEPVIIDNDSLILGYAGVYSSFRLFAQRAGKKYHVDSRSILMELGKIGVVGGQEDMVMDIAAQLSKQQE
jgi:4-hydroxy 2-oxovalerate aldolase